MSITALAIAFPRDTLGESHGPRLGATFDGCPRLVPNHRRDRSSSGMEQANTGQNKIQPRTPRSRTGCGSCPRCVRRRHHRQSHPADDETDDAAVQGLRKHIKDKFRPLSRDIT